MVISRFEERAISVDILHRNAGFSASRKGHEFLRAEAAAKRKRALTVKSLGVARCRGLNSFSMRATITANKTHRGTKDRGGRFCDFGLTSGGLWQTQV